MTKLSVVKRIPWSTSLVNSFLDKMSIPIVYPAIKISTLIRGTKYPSEDELLHMMLSIATYASLGMVMMQYGHATCS